MKKQFLEVGQIVSTHGIKGEVRLNPWCDSPAFLKQFKTLYFDNAGE
jgi:16S rRNA processing protein RimM